MQSNKWTWAPSAYQQWLEFRWKNTNIKKIKRTTITRTIMMMTEATVQTVITTWIVRTLLLALCATYAHSYMPLHLRTLCTTVYYIRLYSTPILGVPGMAGICEPGHIQTGGHPHAAKWFSIGAAYVSPEPIGSIKVGVSPPPTQRRGPAVFLWYMYGFCLRRWVTALELLLDDVTNTTLTWKVGSQVKHNTNDADW